MKVYVLEFESNLQAENPIIHSDTLFAALLKTAHLFGDDVEELKQKFNFGEVAISSVFPYNNDLLIPFNLLIYAQDILSQETIGRYRKKLKKAMIRLKDLQKIDEMNIELERILADYDTKQQIQTKIGLEPMENKVYNFKNLLIKGRKLACIVKGDLKKEFENLGKIGIGADKYVGFGQFKVSTEDYDLKVSGEKMINLSLYIPTKKEWEEISNKAKEGNYFWKIVRREGRKEGVKEYIKAPQNYVVEGAVLPKVELERMRVIDVSKGGAPYSYYRGGIFI